MLCFHAHTSKYAWSFCLKIFCLLTCTRDNIFLGNFIVCSLENKKEEKKKKPTKIKKWLSHLIGHIWIMQGPLLSCPCFYCCARFPSSPKEYPSCVAGASGFGLFLWCQVFLTLLLVDHYYLVPLIKFHLIYSHPPTSKDCFIWEY